MNDRDFELIKRGLESEISELKELVNWKDSIIKKYEDMICDIGAKLDITKQLCHDFNLDKNSTICYHTITFPVYSFCYKYEIQDFRNKLKLLSK